MIKIINEESDFSQSNLSVHVQKYLMQYKNDPRFKNITSDEDFAKKYNEIADKLSRKRVGKSTSLDRYVGYINKDNNRVKYDRYTMDWLIYNFDKSITLHKKSAEEYDKIRKRDFKKEFPYNVNKNI